MKDMTKNLPDHPDLPDKTAGEPPLSPAQANFQSISNIALKGSWPTVFEIDKNQTVVVPGLRGNTTIKLLSASHTKEPDYWTNVTADTKIAMPCTFASLRTASRT